MYFEFDFELDFDLAGFSENNFLVRNLFLNNLSVRDEEEKKEKKVIFLYYLLVATFLT